MTEKTASSLLVRFRHAVSGLLQAIPLNARMLGERIAGRKRLVFHVGAATQLMHVEDVLQELVRRAGASHLSIYLLTKPAELAATIAKAAVFAPGVRVHGDPAARFLIFCSFYSTVDQGEVFPLLGCRVRACSFHGQPSKGNVYQRFNYRRINALFFYGPLMRDHYLKTRATSLHWPRIPYYEVGQPLSDRRVNLRMDKPSARRKLGLDPDRFTVMYAPSFEYCSSLATHGQLIIETLLGMDINLIVKPHPAFYNSSAFNDGFNSDIPTAASWSKRIADYGKRQGCLFPKENSMDSAASICASDVMITDFSGVAFDGILQDLGMIFWDCPRMFDEYLPGRYGIDGRAARRELACNVGRDAGIVVQDRQGLVDAVESYRRDPGHLAEARKVIRGNLLFNPGRATTAMVDKIEEILAGSI